MICKSKKQSSRSYAVEAEARVQPTNPTLPVSLSQEQEFAIYGGYRRAVPVKTLARHYHLTQAATHRALREIGIRRVMELPLDFIPNPEFNHVNAAIRILAETPAGSATPSITRVPAGVPSYLASLYESAVLTREQEGHLFRKFNYLKYLASSLRDQLDPVRSKKSVLDQIEGLYEAAVAVKNQIVQANLRLVVSIAKRYAGSGGDLWDLVSEGNMSLMRAIEKFDFARGYKLSTYASWAIMKNFARSIPKEQQHQNRFRTSHEEMLCASEEHRSDQHDRESAHAQLEARVRTILGRLDAREQQIIIGRFGLDRDHRTQTLSQIGAQLGVSKERVRQIQARAMAKLRLAATAENIEVPGVC